MKVLLSLVTVLFAINAQADGFKCQTVEGDLNIQVYNQTQASEGTRNVAVMVLSSPLVQEGRQTIARFTSTNETVAQKGATYVAAVDLRFNDSARKGELLGGTKLGYLKHIVLAVDFTYDVPVAEGEVLTGTVSFLKRNGEESFQVVECVRYLKGE